MEFQPVYYQEKSRQTRTGDTFDKDKINIVNPHGRAGIVTLWSKPWDTWDRFRNRYPGLFASDSPLVTLTSLYGNGLPQMLANLAHNPQIEYIAVTGNDTKVVPSYTFLNNFLNQGVAGVAGQPLGKINGTEYPIDLQLRPDIFKNLKMQRFGNEEWDGLVQFISQQPTREYSEADRVKIKLIEPEFKDFPSDLVLHTIRAKRPIDAWMDVIYRLDRFGKNLQLGKGTRRALYNLEVLIDDSSPESQQRLAEFGFSWNELKKYREQILDGKLPSEMSYSYGQRMRTYFGIDALEAVVSRFQKDKLDRRGFITMWDNKSDIISPNDSDSSSPCLTNLYFANIDGSMLLTADFRTHNASSAWLLNAYGLRAIQEYVSEKTKIPIGRLNIKSRWIGIDPDDGKINKALELVKKYRKININVDDPQGYFVAEIRGDRIALDHYAPDGRKLKTYEGRDAIEVSSQLRQDAALSDPDHERWVGIQLGALHHKLHVHPYVGTSIQDPQLFVQW